MSEVPIPTGPKVVNPTTQAAAPAAKPIPSPQVPRVAIKPKPPEQKTIKVKAPPPAGWFNFTATGHRAPVIQSIQASNLPDGWKAALIADINALEAASNLITVYAHRQLDNGKYVGHFTIAGKSILA